MKNIMLAILLISFAGTVNAGSCGGGKIISVVEGGWNDNNLRIKIDYSGAVSSHPGTEQGGYIVYKSSLDLIRFNGIKAIILASFTIGQTVNTFSHNDDCSDATQLSIWK